MYKSQKCGTFGDLGVLSFNGNKIITTSGGGALTLKDKEFKKKAVFLSTQAKDDAPHYEHTSIGYNYRMSNICAGIGRGQMEVLNDRVEQRRAMHSFYKQLFENNPHITLHEEPSEDYFSNYWLSVVQINRSSPVTVSEMMHRFQQENIETRPIWKPMHLQPVFHDEAYFGGKVAERLFNNGLCLPSGSNLTDRDRERIEKVIYQIFA